MSQPTDWRTVRQTATCLHTPAAVSAAIKTLADAISQQFADQNPLFLSVLNGGLFFTSELLQHFDFPLQLDTLHATRYQGGTRGKALHWHAKPRTALAGRQVIVLDDMLDEGPTLQAILKYCRDENAASVHSAMLVQKQHDRCVPGLTADFVGLTVPDVYVFGCGMDYAEHWRHLRGIYAVGQQK